MSKVNLIRKSGNPVEPSEMEAKENEWKKGFDLLVEEHGKFGPEIQEALESFESELLEKYNDLTVKKVDFPTTIEAWQELNLKYGNIVVAVVGEANEDFDAKKGDLLFVLPDMELG